MIAATAAMPLSRSRIFSYKLLNSKISVRGRIVAIVVIPVIGFLTNGIAFTAGETDIEKAFLSVEHAARLAEISDEFKGVLAALRIGVRDFIANPDQSSIAAIDSAIKRGAQRLDTMAASASEAERSELSAMRTRIADVAANFLKLTKEQENLGLTETDGIRGHLQDTGAAIETIIHQDLTWVGDEDARKLLISLLTMRRYEAEYRLSQAAPIRLQFFDEIAHFNALFDSVDGAPGMREQLVSQVQAYAAAFAQWVGSMENERPLIASIDSDTQSMIPVADGILDSARQRASTASVVLTASQARTRNFIVWVGCTAVLLGLAFSWWIGRSITRPLDGLANAMTRLAGGDTAARIPATHAKNELGAMARTVLVFRDTMLERERLAAGQASASRERERRGELIAATIGRFEMSVDKVLGKVREASQRLEVTSTQLNSAADEVSAEA